LVAWGSCSKKLKKNPKNLTWYYIRQIASSELHILKIVASNAFYRWYFPLMKSSFLFCKHLRYHQS
jgi:hypothetical protein